MWRERDTPRIPLSKSQSFFLPFFNLTENPVVYVMTEVVKGNINMFLKRLRDGKRIKYKYCKLFQCQNNIFHQETSIYFFFPVTEYTACYLGFLFAIYPIQTDINTV